MPINAALSDSPRRSFVKRREITPAMDATRLAPLKRTCANPASGCQHRGCFPLAPPGAPVGAAAPVFAKGTKRVVEARKQVL